MTTLGVWDLRVAPSLSQNENLRIKAIFCSHSLNPQRPASSPNHPASATIGGWLWSHWETWVLSLFLLPPAPHSRPLTGAGSTITPKECMETGRKPHTHWESWSHWSLGPTLTRRGPTCTYWEMGRWYYKNTFDDIKGNMTPWEFRDSTQVRLEHPRPDETEGKDLKTILWR